LKEVRKMQWWKITNQSGDSAELLLYGSIGDDWLYENTSRDFANAIQGLKAYRNITIRVNSPGGEVTAAQAIYSLIKSLPAYVTMVIDGLAASAASLIVMAGNKIIMPANALMMIHNPMIYAAGDQNDMLHAAEVLQKTKETMLTVYSEKTGKDSGVISQMMDVETWMTAAEALQNGFIDEIDADTPVNVFAKGSEKLIFNGLSVDMKPFKNIPTAYVTAASTRPAHGRRMEESIMNAEQLKTEHPDIYNQVYIAGVTAERERIKGIDGIRTAGYEAIKSKAKYETFEQAGAVAVSILNAQAARMTGAVADIAADVQASNVNAIPMGDAPEVEPAAEAAVTKRLIQKAVDAANANIKKG
jgi:ATP-dependent Clp endopeptidase proteolytic subunit ClpP